MSASITSRVGTAHRRVAVRRSTCAIIVALLLHIPLAAAATTYFVRTSGDDDNDGLTPASARASVRLTARMLQSPGDRLIVGPGTYHEGNILPRGSGTPEAPIVLHADVTGELTGDPPGSVVIVPPNTPTANMGFVVYGRHDVVIEGFDVHNPADPAIHVRPHSRTHAASYNITIRGIQVVNALSRGLNIQAGGDIILTDNTFEGTRGGGIVVSGEDAPPARVTISNNLITKMGSAIVLESVADVTVADNDLRNNIRAGIRMSQCGRVTIARNQIQTPGRAIQGRAEQLVIQDNRLERGVQVSAQGDIDIRSNELAPAGVALSAHGGGNVQLIDNRLSRAYASGLVLTMMRNQGALLEAEGQTGNFTDNEFTDYMYLGTFEGDVDASRNRTGFLRVGGARVVVRENEITGTTKVSGGAALVSGNRTGELQIFRRRWFPNDLSESTVIEDNVCRGTLRVGEWVEPVHQAIVGRNTVAGSVRLFAQSALEVRSNTARAIECAFTEAGADLILSGNTATGSLTHGMAVTRAERGVIEDNLSSESAKSGLVTRASRNLTITRNTFRANQGGGLSVQGPLGGDCNDDFAVTVDEITTIVRIALATSPLVLCAAADLDSDGAITIDEIMHAAAAAFDRPEAFPPRVTVESNEVVDNARFGINLRAVGPVAVRHNRVLRNQGIALSLNGRGQDGIAVVGNVLGSSGAEGLLVRGALAVSLRNNVIFSNREAGVLLRGAPRTSVVNNLIYANGDDGISVGVGAEHPAGQAVVANNTIYANAGWGLTIGTNGVPSTEAVLRNNIIDENLRGGVAAASGSADGLALDYNLRNDPNYESLPVSDSDFEGDPRFVAPAGLDGVLGGEGFEDDNLRLEPGTPARDAGSAPAAELGITGSAIEGVEQDTGVVDVGFHYGASAEVQGAR